MAMEHKIAQPVTLTRVMEVGSLLQVRMDLAEGPVRPLSQVAQEEQAAVRKGALAAAALAETQAVAAAAATPAAVVPIITQATAAAAAHTMQAPTRIIWPVSIQAMGKRS